MEKKTDTHVLAVDVANGLTRLGVFVDGDLVGMGEFSTPRHLTADEAQAQAEDILGRHLTGGPVDGAILSCVVPSHSQTWLRGLEHVSLSRPLVVGPGLKTGVRMRVESPSDVGADRVANVVAARACCGAPAIVVCMGTTTNLEVIDAQGAFVGGAIAPGVMLGARALSEAAARLPLVELRAPKSVVGKNTREAIQAGVVLGEAARADGLIDAAIDWLGMEAPVMLTGHHARAMAPHMRHEATLDEALTLRGLCAIWKANQR